MTTMNSVASRLGQITVGDRASLVLRGAAGTTTTLEGQVWKLLKKSMSVLTDDGFVIFVKYDDIEKAEKLDAQSDREGSCEDSPICSMQPPLPSMTPRQTLKEKKLCLDGRMPVVMDLETTDPDDILTLMIAACHPRINLRAVTVTPGSEDQLLLVQHILSELGAQKEVRLGAQSWPAHRWKKGCVDLDFYGAFLHPTASIRYAGSKMKKKFSAKSTFRGRIEPSSIFPADALIAEVATEHPDNLTLFTGGPLHNLGNALARGAHITRWVGQGGFCGEGVVPAGVPALRAFHGCTHVSTWNFGGAIEATLLALQSELIERRVLVGKNVCHRCEYDDILDARLRSAIEESAGKCGNEMAARWVQHVLSNQYGKGANRKAKKLHDLLAFTTLVDERVCALREVAVDVQGGKWGSSLCEGTSTWAAVDFDVDLFVAALLE